METAEYDRATLIKLSVKRFNEQAKSIKQDIERDVSFIEEKSDLLTKLVTRDARKGLEAQIAERMIRVDNLRTTLQMIDLMQELLDQEQTKEKNNPCQQPLL